MPATGARMTAVRLPTRRGLIRQYNAISKDNNGSSSFNKDDEYSLKTPNKRPKKEIVSTPTKTQVVPKKRLSHEDSAADNDKQALTMPISQMNMEQLKDACRQRKIFIGRSGENTLRRKLFEADSNSDCGAQAESTELTFPKKTLTIKEKAHQGTKNSIPPATPPTKKMSRSPPKLNNKSKKGLKKSSAKVKKEEASIISPPDNWLSTYKLVEELRSDRTAPVDLVGPHVLAQKDLGEKTWRFQLLFTLMLSSQTKDGVVGETIKGLQSMEEEFNIHTIKSMSDEKLNKMIRKVGFHNNKTKYIKQSVDIMLEKYGGDIPDNADELMELPGIGPKMAYIIESVAYEKTTGIGIDTHMHRMFNQLNWLGPTKTKNPEATRKQLERWLPKDYWSTVNVLWVGFGQEVQQYKPKMLQKCIGCSRPYDALTLVEKLGIDLEKEGKKHDIHDKIQEIINNN